MDAQPSVQLSQKSGLGKTIAILENVEGIGIIQLANEDVQRHRLVKAIITAYEHLEEEDKATFLKLAHENIKAFSRHPKDIFSVLPIP